MSDWSKVERILIIRPDNMGDLVMSGPAIRALKHGLDAHITVLTSSAAAIIAPMMAEIDELITFDLPWVRTDIENGPQALIDLVALIRTKHFDAAVIFTVFSQNPLPSAMIAYQAGIPKILAYCRENPYGLITDWVPDNEPFEGILHQVERDLALVKGIVDIEANKRLQLKTDHSLRDVICAELFEYGIDPDQPWIVLHPGVSELKRRLPEQLWIETGKELVQNGYQILITGTANECELTQRLRQGIGDKAINAAGKFNIEHLVTLLKYSPLLLSVNTGTVHLAAAVGTPVVVLYAQTNPQHTPWMVPHAVIEFPVPSDLKSKNCILSYLDRTLYGQPADMPSANTIVAAVKDLIRPLAG